MRLALSGVATLPILWLYGAAGVYAEEKAGGFGAGTDGAALPGDSGAMFMAIVKVIFFLTIIIGIFLIIMKVLAKKKWSWNPARTVFRTMGGLPIGPNKSVQIVEIGKSLYILGVGDSVNLIHKIDDPEEIAYISAVLSPEREAPFQGWQKLRDWLGRLKKGEKETLEDENQVAASFQNVFESKMKHMADRKKLMEDILQSDDDTGRKVDR
ncbi:hypothetical protein GCM10020370_34490 [Paenibacillus hodogayensis]